MKSAIFAYVKKSDYKNNKSYKSIINYLLFWHVITEIRKSIFVHYYRDHSVMRRNAVSLAHFFNIITFNNVSCFVFRLR